MNDYRRNLIAGGSFFFTVNLAERRLRLLTEHFGGTAKIDRNRGMPDMAGQLSARSGRE
jgi:hypothetical protein